MNNTSRLDALINNFAIRCFRDTADKDYICARLAFKAGLYPQFQWSALHCLEKYTKCILLLNRINGSKHKHVVMPCIKDVKSQTRFEIKLSPESLKFIQALEGFARFRYLEVSRGCKGEDIINLDKSVFEIRRYCRLMDYNMTVNGREINMLELNLKLAEKAESSANDRFHLIQGYLEKVLGKIDHPARAGLIWRNLWFSNSKRKTVLFRDFSEFENSPLRMHSEILDEVLKYVYLPIEVQSHYKQKFVIPKTTN